MPQEDTAGAIIKPLKPAQSESVKRYRQIGEYIGDWGAGQNKERLLKNIHKNLLGVDKLGKLRPAEDLAYFLLVCQQYKLNPLKKEMYAVYQSVNMKGQWVEKLEPIVSIHGLRTLARRSKNPTYAYTGKATIEEKDGKIINATVEVFGRFEHSTEVVKVGEYTAYMDEFCRKKSDGTTSRQWQTMPRTMLTKCAEANAIRSAFDIGGVYIEEELGGSDE